MQTEIAVALAPVVAGILTFLASKIVLEPYRDWQKQRKALLSRKIEEVLSKQQVYCHQITRVILEGGKLREIVVRGEEELASKHHLIDEELYEHLRSMYARALAPVRTEQLWSLLVVQELLSHRISTMTNLLYPDEERALRIGELGWKYAVLTRIGTAVGWLAALTGVTVVLLVGYRLVSQATWSRVLNVWLLSFIFCFLAWLIIVLWINRQTKTPMAAPKQYRSVVRMGDYGPPVLALQRSLQRLGYDIGTNIADGRYGPHMLTAVMRFQRACGLKTDGLVGAESKEKLCAAYFKLSSY